MNPEKLAPVFLDNKPVSLNDPRPKVSAVLTAGGKPETTDVKWLKFQTDTSGKSLRGEEILDRTADPAKAIYLTSRVDEKAMQQDRPEREDKGDRSKQSGGRQEGRENREGKGDQARQGAGREGPREDREDREDRPSRNEPEQPQKPRQ